MPKTVHVPKMTKNNGFALIKETVHKAARSQTNIVMASKVRAIKNKSVSIERNVLQNYMNERPNQPMFKKRKFTKCRSVSMKNSKVRREIVDIQKYRFKSNLNDEELKLVKETLKNKR